MSHYDQSFKEEAIRLALGSSKPYAHTARDLGIKPETLYYWLRTNQPESPEMETTEENPAELKRQLRQAMKDIVRLKEERDILKKAAFFAEEAK